MLVAKDPDPCSGESQARFLLAKLNPSSTHANSDPSFGAELIYTDDVALQVRSKLQVRIIMLILKRH